jgi:hypothetical protein
MKSSIKIVAVIFVAMSISACYKPGCMDPDADNYNSDANSADNSCSYNGNVVFWAKTGVADSLILLEHDTLRFELDGEMLDSMPTVGLVSANGECATGGTMKINRVFPGSTKHTYKYRVKGEDYVTIYEGFVSIHAGECEPVQLP